MVGRQLVVRKEAAVDLREVAARATLREVRQKGHAYVELRHVGKRVIFFCTLCHTPCYSDTVLFDHLKGNLHSRRFAAARVTLFGPTPWPFNDGVLFFDNSRERDPLLSISDGQNTMALVISNHGSGKDDEVTSRLRADSNFGNSIVNRNGNYSNVKTRSDVDKFNGSTDVKLQLPVKGRKGSLRSSSKNLAIVSACYGTNSCLTIPGVLLREEVSSLRVHHLGVGQMAYRIQETNEAYGKITKIWCAWLGQGDSGSTEPKVSASGEFAIVNFPYSYGLGRKEAQDEEDTPGSPGSFFQVDDSGRRGKKRRKSFSDQEDYFEGLTTNCGSFSGDSSSLDIVAADEESCQLERRLIPSKAARRELRKQKSLAAERLCDICQQPMLPGKDVATLLNCRTGNLACSSRNTNGAFHPFHASCLIHWILLCEEEMLADHTNNRKTPRGRKGKSTPKNHISSVFCPECQGTGGLVEGEELEKPSISLSEMFLYKLKAIEANKAWMKDPEVLQNCSTGLHFPSNCAENPQEKVVPLKLLHFFRVYE